MSSVPGSPSPTPAVTLRDLLRAVANHPAVSVDARLVLVVDGVPLKAVSVGVATETLSGYHLADAVINLWPARSSDG